MADIAMLVAEEYERRVKNSRKGGEAEAEKIDLFSSVSVWVRRLDGSGLVKKKVGEEKLQLFKRLLEPKTQIGLAAIHGVFSA